MASIPFVGRQASPEENMRKTKWNMRLDVCKSDSRKMPPRNGRKNRSTIEGENPASCSA